MIKTVIMANPAGGQLPWYQVSYSEALDMDLSMFVHLYEDQIDNLLKAYARSKAKQGGF